MASFRQSARAQCRAYASAEAVRRVIRTASTHDSSAEMASQTDLTVCSPPGAD